MENENATLEGLVNALGGPATETTPAPDLEPAPEAEKPQTEEQPPEHTDAPEETEPSKVEEDSVPAQHQEDSTEKAKQAFIHMRQQNKQQADLLRQVAGMYGIENLDPKDDNQLLSAIQEHITAEQAKQQNVPPEMLQRLNYLEQRDQARVAEERQRDAAFGFQRVADTFKLEQKELNKFATDLLAKGINPLDGPVDLIREYTIMHHEDIVKAEVAKAIAAEQARTSKAKANASTPDKKTGGTNNSGKPDKVTSVRDLEAWFNSMT